ncbi:hypothetical protein ELE36_19215 [Pseudolysobacter antarcticus]|uniref:Autotransporter outer membrane beta-barrel domain-containing protein n=1 Tax=Pseudolysobacter antarcticus TaxID=2511995 RepID=A0A411HPB6_9GAMM|nr:hypothetical protein [Pseudolysobacter antarcticus]QBB72327.1 hypothetical protein ELE36_19215 [Pseudolysobacter antarcticus]
MSKNLACVLQLGLRIAVVAFPGVAAATTYVAPITGVSAHDGPGGAGNYVPAYSIHSSNGALHYVLSDADLVQVATSLPIDVSGLNLSSTGGSSPVVLDVGNGTGRLSVSSVRGATGVWGVATGMSVDDGGALTVNGSSSVYAQSDDAVPTSASLGVRVHSGSATFQGDAQITTYTPGYSQGIWVYQGIVNFNGAATILAQARGESTSGVYNSGGGISHINFNRGATISALAIHPSDNVHGIYNDNQNSAIAVTGSLDINAVSQGSTAFGVRNQGVLNVSGNTHVTTSGPRSTFGIANTHRTARVNLLGDTDITVSNGTNYVPFGNPTAIANNYPGTSVMRFGGAVRATITATTETYAVDNASTLQIPSLVGTTRLGATTSCSGCNVYGIRNQGGTVEIAGGLVITTQVTPPGNAYAIWNVAAGGQSGTILVNEAGGQSVQLDGDIVTGALLGETGTASTRVFLATPSSFLLGNVLGYAGANGYYHAGTNELHVGAAASWEVVGTGLADFGSGSLTVDGRGVIDSSRLLTGGVTIDGTEETGAVVTLADQAVLRLYSDVSGSTAGSIRFGSGIQSFLSEGTLRIAIGHDPVFDRGTLSDSNTAVFYPAIPRITVIDAAKAAAGTGQFAAVDGLTLSLPVDIAGVARMALVRPVVERSEDKHQVLLSGIWVQVLPIDTIFRAGFDS